MPDKCRISVIIPCYKRPDLVCLAVRSALQQDLDPEEFEVLVVDSSPDDSVVTAVEALRPEARCRLTILRKKAEGPGPSRNMGAAHAESDIFVFFDSDCQATPGWLRAYLQAFAPGIGLVQGRTLPNPDQPGGIFTHTICVEQESFLYETANIAYRRESYEQAGGFQADWNPNAITPLGGEDVDLAWRVKRAGWASTFAPDALIYHEVLRMKISSWIWIPRRQLFPVLVREHPELRKFFFARYFFDPAQAYLCLALLGFGFVLYSPWWLLLTVPYIYHRASGPTKTLRGPLRLIRPAFYSLRDGATLLILLWSSARARSVLL